MLKKSAGLLMYRHHNGTTQVLLVHPGGPFFAKKDHGVWSIPKGEFDDEEEPLKAAIREFTEELGAKPEGKFIELQPVRQKAGKLVYAWAIEGDLDTSSITCNTFVIEWPPRSGKMQTFPEIDKAEWFDPDEARNRINPAQVALLDQLVSQKLTT